MSKKMNLYVFGEVLYDCFPDGEAILGGAPFNVAWHLRGFGGDPHFISRVGRDEHGEKVIAAMKNWGMDTSMVALDDHAPTGQVKVAFIDNEPQYNIVDKCAYDFISGSQVTIFATQGILYHGSLCLRNPASYEAYQQLVKDDMLKVFLDVNLRDPWWNRNDVLKMLESATWVKMNLDELQLLAGGRRTTRDQMSAVQKNYDLEQIIVTRGEDGALIRDQDGQFYSEPPAQAEQFVDTVGAGDAFSSMYIYGIQSGLDTHLNLRVSQKFASKIVGIRGATTTDKNVYKEFL